MGADVQALPGTRRFATLWRSVAAVACVALVATGCAAGQQAQTARDTPAIDGVSTTLGKISLSGVSVAAPSNGPSYPVGAMASLQFSVVNTGTSDDELTNVTTSAAAGVGPAPTATATDTATDTATVTATDTATGNASASASATTSTAPAPFDPVQLAPNVRVAYGLTPTDPVIVLSGLTAPLYGGNTIRVTFTFANAGTITLTVPVQLTSSTSPTGLVVPEASTSAG